MSHIPFWESLHKQQLARPNMVYWYMHFPIHSSELVTLLLVSGFTASIHSDLILSDSCRSRSPQLSDKLRLLYMKACISQDHGEPC